MNNDSTIAMEVTKDVSNQTLEGNGQHDVLQEDTLANDLAKFFNNAFQKLDINIPPISYTEQTLVKLNNNLPINDVAEILDVEYGLIADDKLVSNEQQTLKVRLPMISPAKATSSIELYVNLDPMSKDLLPSSQKPLFSSADVLFNPEQYTCQSTMRIYDANGEQHFLYFLFRKIGLNTWESYVFVNQEMITPVIDNIDAKPLVLSFSSQGKHDSEFKINFKPNDNLPCQEINIKFNFTEYNALFCHIAASDNGCPQGNFLKIQSTEQKFNALYNNNTALELGTFEEFLLSIGLKPESQLPSPVLLFSKVLQAATKQEHMPKEGLAADKIYGINENVTKLKI